MRLSRPTAPRRGRKALVRLGPNGYELRSRLNPACPLLSHNPPRAQLVSDPDRPWCPLATNPDRVRRNAGERGARERERTQRGPEFQCVCVCVCVCARAVFLSPELLGASLVYATGPCESSQYNFACMRFSKNAQRVIDRQDGHQCYASSIAKIAIIATLLDLCVFWTGAVVDVLGQTASVCRTVLFCTVVSCAVVYCTVLHCTVLYCPVLY